MRVVVCGSRTWTDRKKIRARLEQLPHLSTVIHGAASGADQLAAVEAHKLGHQVLEMPARWRVEGIYNPKAGIERNKRMLDLRPELVIAFWDGQSRGTKHTIDEAIKRGIALEVQQP